MFNDIIFDCMRKADTRKKTMNLRYRILLGGIACPKTQFSIC